MNSTVFNGDNKAGSCPILFVEDEAELRPAL
jgi:hypothetical protein